MSISNSNKQPRELLPYALMLTGFVGFGLTSFLAFGIEGMKAFVVVSAIIASAVSFMVGLISLSQM